MILGTVELGLDYGINNNEGKPSNEQAFDLLNTAWIGGIRELDTAAAYGDAEMLIGQYQHDSGNTFQIDTKLPVLLNKNEYMDSFKSSCKKLGVKNINLLYLHSFEQCRNRLIIDFLKSLKKNGLVNHIGISIYEPDEMVHILDNLPVIDTIQFPYNLLDSYRWRQNNLIKSAHDLKKNLYVRSIFLQGLIFKDEKDVFTRKIGASKYIACIGRLARKAKMTIPELAYKYVLETEEITEVIFGCQKKEEVACNLNFEKSKKKIPIEVRQVLDDFSQEIPSIIIDPRRWEKV